MEFISIEADDATPVISIINDLIFTNDKKTQFLNFVGQSAVEHTLDRAEQEIAPDGTPWDKSIRASAQGGQTGRDTGRMLNSLTHLVSGDSVEWGTNVLYAPVFSEGATIKAKNAAFLHFKTSFGWVKVKEVTIPARPLLGFTDEDEASVMDMLNFLMTRP